MIEVNGKHTNAKIFTDNIEQEAISQIYSLINTSMFEKEVVRIMPDTHSGKGCVIGFTSTTNNNKIIPNLIGVDIGCGMLTVCLGNIDINLDKLDKFINKEIPSGFCVNEVINSVIPSHIRCDMSTILDRIGDLDKYNYHLKSLGSLGGGNHFIEIDTDENGNKYLIIHSGSRNFGHKIATYYQNKALQTCDEVGIPKELKYLQGNNAKEYLYSMRVAQKFAKLNRELIVSKILKHLSIYDVDYFETVHNYIGDDNIIRKGAISAKKDERVLIPFNMKDGCIIATGLGNKDWNNSAPHGAGRLMSRSRAKAELNLEKFKDDMNGVYSTSIGASTLDEAPMAYKNSQEIIKNIEQTVKVEKYLKPIYNFKAH